ncbi:MAG: hypothetical protein O7J95_13310 [Planctomycetota bacterium]|nr:hypothetical protein [Planctomycetota bacterium]
MKPLVLGRLLACLLLLGSTGFLRGDDRPDRPDSRQKSRQKSRRETPVSREKTAEKKVSETTAPEGKAEEKVPEKKAAAKPSIENHVRLKRDKNSVPVALQTSVIRYVPASGDDSRDRGLVVDLIAALHIGDPGYYQYLNRHFDQYDALLYELVAPPKKRVPRRDEEGESPLRLIQKICQSALNLSHQLDGVDYTKENFVHADMSPEEMAKAIEKRGDDGLTLALSIAADVLRQRNLRERAAKEKPQESRRIEAIDPFELLLDEHGSTKFKRLMAEQFSDFAGGSGLGPTIDTILIKDRNRAAMRVFQKELAKGKKRIGIFYGAAHMPDFERRLMRDFGLKRQDIQWVTAWDLRLERKSPVEGILSAVLEELLREAFRQRRDP